MSIPIKAEITKGVCGNTVLLYGMLYVAGKPANASEIIMMIDGEAAAATLTTGGGFTFTMRLPAGMHTLELILYRQQVPDPTRPNRVLEVTKKIYETRVFIARPSPVFRIFGPERCPRAKYTLKEAASNQCIKDVLKENGIREAYLVGGIVTRGYSCHDVDVYVPSRLGAGKRESIVRQAVEKCCVVLDVFDEERKPRKKTAALKLL